MRAVTPLRTTVHASAAQLLALLAGKAGRAGQFPSFVETQLSKAGAAVGVPEKTAANGATKAQKQSTIRVAAQPSQAATHANVAPTLVIPILMPVHDQSQRPIVEGANSADPKTNAKERIATPKLTVPAENMPAKAAATGEHAILGGASAGPQAQRAAERPVMESGSVPNDVSQNDDRERQLAHAGGGAAQKSTPVDGNAESRQPYEHSTFEPLAIGQRISPVTSIGSSIVSANSPVSGAVSIPLISKNAIEPASAGTGATSETTAPTSREHDIRPRVVPDRSSAVEQHPVAAREPKSEKSDRAQVTRSGERLEPARLAAPEVHVSQAASVNAGTRGPHDSPGSGLLQENTAASSSPKRELPRVTTYETPAVQSPMAFHSLRLTEHIAGPELHFTWRSQESGDIQLSTSLHHRDVQVTVNTDRTDTAAAMRVELPSLDNRLHEHSLRLGDVNIVAQERSVATELGSSGQQRGQRDWSASAGTSRPSENVVGSEMKSESLPMVLGDGRVSVLA